MTVQKTYAAVEDVGNAAEGMGDVVDDAQEDHAYSASHYVAQGLSAYPSAVVGSAWEKMKVEIVIAAPADSIRIQILDGHVVVDTAMVAQPEASECMLHAAVAAWVDEELGQESWVEFQTVAIEAPSQTEAEA